jgi:methylated-DNA-[protein]-cysteine S-methyltransferase
MTTTRQPDPSATCLHETAIDTPLGRLRLRASEVGLRSVGWDDEDLAIAPARGEPAAGSVLALAVEQLGDYFAGRRADFDLPLDEVGTPFQRSAWSALRTIPYGATISYGQQAARLGDARKARAVGGANSRNPIAVVTPCHRVIGADGSLTGFAAGTDRKRWLLDHEARILTDGAHPAR